VKIGGVAERGWRRIATLAGSLGLLGVSLLGCSPHATLSSPVAASTAAMSGVGAPLVGAGGSCPAPTPNTPGASLSKLPLRSLCALPAQAAQVWHAFSSGGRLNYWRDGIVFSNAEKRLPLESRGYYHEYTVPTPGARTRGPRRLITGQQHELYYTGDHYSSFVVVDPTAD
jgi:ribonuclease T1